MSAEAATSTKRTVTERKTLMADLLVSFKVPTKTQALTTADGQPYTQFGVPITGGFINFYLFGKPKMVGNRVHGKAAIMMKRMCDGTEFLYVDIQPSSSERQTHELKIAQDYQKIAPELLARNPLQYRCSGKTRGAVLVCKL